MPYITQYLEEATQVINQIDPKAIEKMLKLLIALKKRRGRLFFLGIGGGAGNSSHAVNDFRKIAGLEAYTPTDNVPELTARINDEGWEYAFINWLRGSRLTRKDMVFVFSVGGGDEERKVSVNLIRALEYAKRIGATVCGLVGRNGGYTARVAHVCIVIPVVNPETVTAHTESIQALLFHLLVSHPRLRMNAMKWESIQEN